MPSITSLASTAVLLLSTATTVSAHFNLVAPPTIGFDDDNEGKGPCGGFTPDFTKSDGVVDFHVGGEPVAVKLGHSQANWLFRATLDKTGASNWTQLFPIVQQAGLGTFCETGIPAPEAWVGQQGVVGVVANAPDGLLYQCATVNFVSGTGTPGSTCTNASTVTGASFVPDTALSALVGAGADNATQPTSTPSSSSPAGTSPSGTTSPSPSASHNAAAGLGPAVGGLMAAAAFVGLGML